jgi:hypothetical protein
MPTYSQYPKPMIAFLEERFPWLALNQNQDLDVSGADVIEALERAYKSLFAYLPPPARDVYGGVAGGRLMNTKRRRATGPGPKRSTNATVESRSTLTPWSRSETIPAPTSPHGSG